MSRSRDARHLSSVVSADSDAWVVVRYLQRRRPANWARIAEPLRSGSWANPPYRNPAARRGVGRFSLGCCGGEEFHAGPARSLTGVWPVFGRPCMTLRLFMTTRSSGTSSSTICSVGDGSRTTTANGRTTMAPRIKHANERWGLSCRIRCHASAVPSSSASAAAVGAA